MPYKSERILIERTDFDRRIKLTEEDRAQIKEIRENTGQSYGSIAKEFGVSKRLIIFICNPDVAEQNRQAHKERRKDGRYYDRDKWRDAMKEHRNYKQKLFIAGKIKL
jgi:hypothetical protein